MPCGFSIFPAAGRLAVTIVQLNLDVKQAKGDLATLLPFKTTRAPFLSFFFGLFVSDITAKPRKIEVNQKSHTISVAWHF